MDENAIKSQLLEGVGFLELSESQVEKLLQYLFLLIKWNKTYNLTAIRDPKEMVRLHLLDSLSVLPYIKSIKDVGAILDVGAGAGLPSIPLAICLPERQVYAVDKVHKKTSFMQQVKSELSLANFNSLHARVEELKPVDFGEDGISVIISRAFSEIALFVSLTKHLLKNGGCWLAMKGVMPKLELKGLVGLGEFKTKVMALKVEQLEAQRHLVEIRING